MLDHRLIFKLIKIVFLTITLIAFNKLFFSIHLPFLLLKAIDLLSIVIFKNPVPGETLSFTASHLLKRRDGGMKIDQNVRHKIQKKKLRGPLEKIISEFYPPARVFTLSFTAVFLVMYIYVDRKCVSLNFRVFVSFSTRSHFFVCFVWFFWGVGMVGGCTQLRSNHLVTNARSMHPWGDIFFCEDVQLPVRRTHKT